EHNRTFTATRKAVRRMLAKLGYDDLTLLCLVKKADMMAHSERGFKELPIIDACEALIEEMRSEDVALKVTDLNINGYDLRDLGMADGPEMGRVLNTLLEEVLNEQIENNHDQLIERAKKLSS
ncbi:MAG: hypothetical protein ACSW8B_01415, partial [bacterium]